ncbi:ferritin-like protein [Kitasatospora sp. NPDC093806]|uniref:ferritin-like domain-containing protein n=1 Tax=Kitasatospora sp. NPDC093806 TaxID=3155075 RepID=UPI003444168E
MTGVLDFESAEIVRLMNIAEDDWTEQELKDALQRAIMLELSTIPPYATALWSITTRDDKEPVFHGIKEIIFDEMSHFGLVCNMLTAIGGDVVLNDPLTVPKYPGELPGGVNPGLEVFLSGLSRDSAALFAAIEKPEHPLAFAPDGNTIGAFYTRIAKVFPTFEGLIHDRNQVTFNLSSHGTGNDIVPMTSLDAVLHAIEIIKAQGEGTEASPENPFPGRPDELAHYYVFMEIAKGKKLVQDPVTGKFDFNGAEVPLPPTAPVGRVPRGGWAGDPGNAPDPNTAKDLHEFNVHYSTMLDKLQHAWSVPTGQGGAFIGQAIGQMGAMRTSARKVNAVKLPADPRFTYGPEWLLVPLP